MLGERAVVGDRDAVFFGNGGGGVVQRDLKDLRSLRQPNLVAIHGLFNIAVFGGKFYGVVNAGRGDGGTCEIGGVAHAVDFLGSHETPRAVVDGNKVSLVRTGEKSLLCRLLSGVAARNDAKRFFQAVLLGNMTVAVDLVGFDHKHDVGYRFGALKGKKRADDDGKSAHRQPLLGQTLAHACRASARQNDGRGHARLRGFSSEFVQKGGDSGIQFTHNISSF